MSLPRLLRTPCARSLTKSTLSPASLRLLPAYKPFSTSRTRLEELTIDDDLYSKLPGIDPSRLELTETITPKALVSNQDLVFGRTFTDHMLSIEWTAAQGWLAPRLTPYQNLSLDPATCVFHYAFECFEGMKAYKCKKDNSLRLFRPEKNMARMNKSAARIALPTFDGKELIDLIGKLCRIDERFISSEKGYSLYLRPTLIGTQRTLGVGPPGSALLYVIASPVGPYYPTGFKAISLEATDYAVRAWPGGVGDKKLGANYAPCIVPQLKAAKKGLHQNLWLFGPEQLITEVGTMNLFVCIKNKETGQKELLTAPLDGTILEGVTRDSVLALARERLEPEGWKVMERYVKMQELADAEAEGRLIEVFGAGTAAIVAPVRKIAWKDQMLDCGLKPNEEAGEVALKMKGWMEDIQYGDEDHPWSVKIS
ncbi:branched-chain-amino-acid transaminase bat2 [Exophiala xenobiotica]|nr:branched-chain-amino-acid transaminase bat2 [Exophiala xenobiotica]KAK5227865.1 branched-chain-amino-acid transaminase bat2 [Exophiala xenobiotica]KAK5253412.1 branched-chain-amino-acid transaminase bat2 [Exophiala xenobiotica]KAK5346684.1 branched-chain-amino-acid transaminase bat2 [Exophiala xenobiotica]KAK5360372.1 branched-chain-amino-acid transaminase bat2 [Exophiala xenobiotica]